MIVDKKGDDSDDEDDFITKEEEPLVTEEPPPPQNDTNIDEEGGEHGKHGFLNLVENGLGFAGYSIQTSVLSLPTKNQRR